MEAALFPLRVPIPSRRSISTVGSPTNRRDRISGFRHPLEFSSRGVGEARSPLPATPEVERLAATICFRARSIGLERLSSRICFGTGPPAMPSEGAQPTELNEESDFDALVSVDGHVSICGFGSLLSERSARSTFPELRDFRAARLRGFRRVFCHTAPVFFERGIAKENTGEISSLSVEPCDGETLVVTVFEIKRSEIPSFIEREHEFRFLAVTPEDLDGSPYTRPAVLCARYSDDEYFHIRCKGSKEIYFQRYGRYGIHKIWRDDVLPCRVYLRHCVLAAKNLGEEAYNNFLDHTYIADRETTIQQYLSSTGSGIMEEEPPESLRSRYGG